jgi:hypothetical protein
MNRRTSISVKRFRVRASIPAGLVLACTASPALAQVLGTAPDDGISIWRVLFAFVLCAGLAAAGAFALKARMGGGGSFSFLAFPARQARRLKLVETLRVAQKVDLCLVSLDGDEFLVLAGEEGARVVERSGRANPVRLPHEDERV